MTGLIALYEPRRRICANASTSDTCETHDYDYNYDYDDDGDEDSHHTDCVILVSSVDQSRTFGACRLLQQ